MYQAYYIAFWFLAMGIFTSVSLSAGFHLFVLIPSLIITIKDFSSEKLKQLPISLWIFFALLVWGYVSTIMNWGGLEFPMRSLGKNKYLIFSILVFLSLPKFTTSYFKNFQFEKLIKVFVFSIVLATTYGVIVSKIIPLIEGERLLRNPGLTGIMRYSYGLSMVLPLFLGMYLQKMGSTSLRKFLLWGILFSVIGILTSLSRGALLGMLCSLPFVIYFYNKKAGLISFLSVGGVVAILVGFSVLGIADGSRFFKKISAATNLMRLSQYEAAIMTLKDNPVFGVGLNDFSHHCPKIKDKYHIYFPSYCQKFGFDCDYSHRKQYCSHAHNIFLQMGADLGAIGLVLFILWVLFWIYEMMTAPLLLKNIMLPFFASFLVGGQFEMIFDANNMFFIFTLYPISLFLRNYHALDNSSHTA